MALPVEAAGAVGLAENLGKITDISGSVSDLISLGFTIADHLKAQEGLTYNIYAFKIGRKKAEDAKEEDKSKKPASLGTPTKKKGSSAATQSAPEPETQFQLIGGSTSILEIKSGSTDVLFGITFFRAGEDLSTLVGIVNLWKRQGFDVSVGDQAAVEFNGVELEGAHLLTISGWVNEWLEGFFNFSGQILIRNDPPSSNREMVVPVGYPRKIGKGGFITSIQHGYVIQF